MTGNYVYGLVLRETTNRRTAYVFDDAMHDDLESALNEAEAMRKYCETECMGIFAMDTKTGDARTVLNMIDLDAALADRREKDPSEWSAGRLREFYIGGVS